MNELYKLPAGWEWTNLEEVCEILDRLRKPISQKDRIAGQYPYYGASGILDYINQYIFNERLVLIGEDGAKWGANENSSFIADGMYWVNNHAHVIRPNTKLTIDSFIVYYLNATDLDEYITGATVRKLNQQKLKSIQIPLPPLAEQKRIVAKLDSLFEKIDKAIELHQQNITNANTLMASTLDKTFKKLEGEYSKQVWSDILIIKNGKHYKDVIDENGKYPIYGSGGIIGYANNYISNENSVIIGRKGTINSPMFIKQKFWNIDTAFGIEANKDTLLPEFLYYFTIVFNFLDLNKSTTLPILRTVF